jgi:DMSO/TMAO reductase YedYZ heme-binding membrane subunit
MALIPKQSRPLWIRSFLFSIGILAFALLYDYVRLGSFNAFAVNRAIIFSGVLLILISHALSGTSYFWKIGSKYLGYRKALGVIGFLWALVHAYVSAWLHTDSLLLTQLLKNNPANVFAFIAIWIFIGMVAISNFGMPARLGAKLWRQLLRVGYVAIILIFVHFTLHSFDTWISWVTTFSPILPPLSLFLGIFSLFTLILRVFLYFALRKTISSSIC